jgi:hypothetical protein
MTATKSPNHDRDRLATGLPSTVVARDGLAALKFSRSFFTRFP